MSRAYLTSGGDLPGARREPGRGSVGWVEMMVAQEIEVAYTFDHEHFSRLEGITVRVPGEE